ncbi:MAG: hypothetical protein PHT69_08155 [Bacteroidales bacterium]|nr:hypothetical protein [Bacteroidales bacterium]
MKKLVFILMFFYVLAGLNSCKEKEIIPEPPSTGEFHFIATINEKSKHLVSGRNGYRLQVETVEIDSPTDPEVQNVVYAGGLSQLNDNYYIKSSEEAYVYFDNNWFNKTDYAADPEFFFNSVFTSGSRIFCNSTDEVTPCVEIFWKDTYSKEWNSRTGSQTGSAFTITEVIVSSDDAGLSRRLVKATFNCKLYNEVGDFLELKNGQLFLIFRRA